jgi:hypothetical protein
MDTGSAAGFPGHALGITGQRSLRSASTVRRFDDLLYPDRVTWYA